MLHHVALLLLVVCTDATPSLELARLLVPPNATLSKAGEYEGQAFWDQHDALLKAAWLEYGPKWLTLYTFNQRFESLYITPEMRTAVKEARQSPTHSEAKVQSLFGTVAPRVTSTTRLFTPLFNQHLLQELDHLAQSGIPQRRPNGMNRYGAILDDIGLGEMLQGLVTSYLAPLAATHFPHAAVWTDIDHHFAFMVRYRRGEDVSLAEHSDASVITMNLCLGKEFKGGELEFSPFLRFRPEQPVKNQTQPRTRVALQPGLVLFHQGQHRHAAAPLESGERFNLILWLHAKHGTVRMAEYKPEEHMAPAQRWGGPVGRNFLPGRGGSRAEL